MLSEHPMTIMFADLVGGKPFTQDGPENTGFFARPKYDYIIMPSGFAMSTDACIAQYQMAQMFRQNAIEALLRAFAYGEEWSLSHDRQSYDPRTNKVDPLADGGTGKPSPTLLPYYSNPKAFEV